MSKKYYLCDVIGAGTEFDPYRPAVADLGVSWSGVVGPGGQALVIVATANHARVRSAKGVDALPDFPLDGRLNAIDSATMGGYTAALARRNLGSPLANSEGFRAELNRVGRLIEPTFEVASLDVSE